MNAPTVPHMDNPPITELVIDLYFHPLQNLKSNMLEDLRKLFEDKYPEYSEQPNISVELDTNVPPMPFVFGFGPQLHPIRRQWYTQVNQTQLFQFQQDRFITNWRPYSLNDEKVIYPSFKVVFEEFSTYLSKLEKFVLEQLGEKMNFIQWEIKKINLLELADDWKSSINEYFTVFSDLKYKNFTPEALAYSERLLLTDENGPFGKLEASIATIEFPENKKKANFMLTARGINDIGSNEICIKRMERANLLLDSLFVSMTKEDVRKNKWGHK